MFITQEIPDGGAVTVQDYVVIGRVMNFDYGKELAMAVNRKTNFKYFYDLGPSWFYGGTNI